MGLNSEFEAIIFSLFTLGRMKNIYGKNICKLKKNRKIYAARLGHNSNAHNMFKKQMFECETQLNTRAHFSFTIYFSKKPFDLI